jgi:alkaline phosphatase D
MMWDDHELANNSWMDGAENHQPDSEGEWPARKAAAIKACREWLPISENAWESYEIGDLATLLRPETRVSGRVRQLDLSEALAGRRDVAAALAEFRDGPWQDPARTILGAEQEAWLQSGFRRSVRDGKRWQLLAQQVIMGSSRLAPEIADMLTPQASEQVRRIVTAGVAASRAGLPFGLDMWDGYPAARERLLRGALDADANLVVLSGDSHNAWAFDLDVGGTPAGVDMAVQSVTSPGAEAYLPWISPADMARVTVAANPQLKWADTSRRGYLTVELTPERATGEWLFLDTIRTRSTAIGGRHRMGVSRGANRLG